MVKALSLVLLVPTLLLGGIPDIRRPVTDPRALLSPADTEAVSDGLVRLRTETGVQLAVLIVGTTEGTPIEDYAQRVAEQWKGGDAGQDNGALLVIAVDDHRMRLQVGYGLEAYLPDDMTRRLLDAQGPRMRAGDYRGALLAIVQGVRGRLPEGGPSHSDWTPWSAERVRNAFMWMLWTALGAALLVAGCLGPWRERLGSVARVGAVAVLVLVPTALVALAVRHSQVPMAHFLLGYGGLLAAFFLGALAFRKVSARVGVILVVSTVLGAGIAWGMHESTDLMSLLVLAACIAGGLAVAMFVFAFAFSSGIFDGFTLGSSGSGSSWSSSSSDSSSSSSSDSSWGGGGGDFGGGGSSSSW